MDPSDWDWPGSPLLTDLMTTALVAAGVRETIASYWSGLALFSETKGTIWLATDLGLVRADVAIDPERMLTSEVESSVTLEICPWVDVINPELTVEASTMGPAAPTLLVRLMIQIPRVDLRAGGDPTRHSDASRLGRFGAAVLAKRR